MTLATGYHDEFEPSYLALFRSGELKARVGSAWERLKSCDLCARYCHVDRLQGTRGAICRTGEQAIVHSYGPHHGEEDPLRGTRGSGTIFFSWCNLRCVFCQNWEISHKGTGDPVTTEQLAQMMLELQAMGCHNINLVSPSHVVAQILAAVESAAHQGLALPLVYNTGGFDSLEALALLDGVVDIYMPDLKYGHSDTAHRYSRVRDYVAYNQAAVKEMHRQVDDLVLNADGIARRGLLIRHLVMPGLSKETASVLRFIADELSTDSYVNLMDQYHPCYRSIDYPPLDRPLSHSEYVQALEMAKNFGLGRLDHPRGLMYQRLKDSW